MDGDIFTEYVKKLQPAVFRVAYSYVKDRQDAEDITQEVFLKLYRTDEKFSADENVKAWLIRVTVNLSKNLLRSAWRRKRLPLERDVELPAPADYELLRRLNGLKPEYRAALYLFYYEGYSAKEIAAFTGVSEASIRARLKRGRDKLRTELIDDFMKGLIL